ncbi:MAG: S-methyl-5-thioribose-1-phosphate isomerase [Polyangiaceae bacterium]
MNQLPHPSPLSGTSYSAAELSLDNETVYLLDQRRLPQEEHYVAVRDVETMVIGIRDMWVRGAPAIGVAAAYAAVLATQQTNDPKAFEALLDRIASARPTAVNLRWAVERMRLVARGLFDRDRASQILAMAEEARALHREDVAANRRMGDYGAALVPDDATILTHCNAGALATGGYGTALGVIRSAVRSGKRVRVFADETRPWLQGARLTAWELARDSIDVTVLCDGAAGSLFRAGRIDLAVVGADRIARNGDVANKIGTYTVASLCRVHDRPLYVAAPMSTVDMSTARGDAIVIEERPGTEVTDWGGVRHVPAAVPVINPSFDVTPAAMIAGLFTERGVASPLGERSLAALVGAVPSSVSSTSAL